MAHILLVDDDLAMLSFLEKALEKSGHTVTSHNNGQDAFSALQKNEEEFALLLTDIVMPGMDGIELAKKSTALYPDLKTMFITGFSASSINQNNSSPTLSKPFHLKELINKIDEVLQD